MILVRAESGVEIGDGHIMRCLSLSSQLSSYIGSVTLVSQNTRSYSAKQWRKSFRLVKWKHEIGSLQDALELRHFAIENKIKILILDHYSISETYVKVFKNVCKIILFDDLAQRNVSADLIINSNLGAERHCDSYSLAKEMALGLKYASFRPPIIAAKKYGLRGRYLMIALSNSQPPGLTISVLEALETLGFNQEIKVLAPEYAIKYSRSNVEWLAPRDISDVAAFAWRKPMEPNPQTPTTIN